jgi:hypothetical protein
VYLFTRPIIIDLSKFYELSKKNLKKLFILFISIYHIYCNIGLHDVFKVIFYINHLK